MPIYCYRKGERVAERFFPIGTAPQTIRLKGDVLHRDLVAEHRKGKCPANVDPVAGSTSTALAVPPQYRGKAMARAKELGVPTFFNERGEPVWESRGHRKRFCERIEVYDMNGGYSDPQRK